MSGALYDSMFVVEINSTGAEILFLIVPGGNECLLVKLRFGTGVEVSEDFAPRLVVNALERLDMVVVDF